jgi:hypothetical protein
MKAIGGAYLVVNPDLDSDNAVDLRRVWLPRVQVTLVKIHRGRLRPYEVKTADGRLFIVGRLDKVKVARAA